MPTSCWSPCPRRPRSFATRCAMGNGQHRHAGHGAEGGRPARTGGRTKPVRPPRPRAACQRVVIEKPRFDIRDYLWSGTIGLASLIGQIMVVTFLTYFLLLSGRHVPPQAGQDHRAQLLQTRRSPCRRWTKSPMQIQRYLLVQMLTSALVGRGDRAGVLGLGAGARGGVGYCRRHPEPDPLHRLHRGHRRRGIGRIPAVRRDRDGSGRGRGLAPDPHHRGQPARALADQQGQPA